MTKNTYGTGSFVLMNVGEVCPEPVDGLLTTVAWTIPGGSTGITTQYAFEGAIFVTGAAVQWLRDGISIISEASRSDRSPRSIPDTEGVYFVPAFTGLGSPWWDPYARGTVVGITRHRSPRISPAPSSRRCRSRRATSSRRCRPVRATPSARCAPTRRVDDGVAVATASRPVASSRRPPAVKETTALGAAYLAGLAEGVWDSTEDITANWALDVEVAPAIPAEQANAAYAEWKRAVERASRLGAGCLQRGLRVRGVAATGWLARRGVQLRTLRQTSTRETECRRSALTPPLGASLVRRNN